MPKTIFAVNDDTSRLIDYQLVLKPKLDDGSYSLTTFKSPWNAYREMLNSQPGPDLLITAFDFDRHPKFGGPDLIRKVHELGSRTKFIMSDAMHESNVRRTLDELKRDEIDVRYIPYYSVDDNLVNIVESLIQG